MTQPSCTTHDHNGPVREDYIDFPTGWRIQCEGLTHTDERCSAWQTAGAMLCDCDALRVEWQRRVAAQQGATDSHASVSPEQTPSPAADSSHSGEQCTVGETPNG